MEPASPEPIGVAIIGAGFAGLGMGAKLLEQKQRDFTIFEAAEQLGGTWRDNVYPGCACDVPSHLYSFSFERSAEWSHTYGRQPEILDYLERFAARRGLEPFIRFGQLLDRVQWDDEAQVWRLQARSGASWTALAVVAGTGPLRVPAYPELPGRETYRGETMHTARWRSDVDLSGKRVAVIGTGASAIQVIPELARTVDHLTVFQRTPPWVMPRRDHPISGRKKAWLRRFPVLSWLLRAWTYLVHEAKGSALFAAPRLGRLAEGLARRHLARQVADPGLRARLTPSYRIGCKRVLLSDTYYPALQRPNVELVSSGAARVTPAGVVASDGTEHPCDVLVYATGFDVTSFLAPLEVRGQGGIELSEAWRAGAQAYLGVTVSGFPNLFLLLGPNTGLGHNSVVFMIEAQIHYVLRLLRAAKKRQASAVTVRPAAVEGFAQDLRRRLDGTVWNAGGCRSWYLDDQGRNVVLWPGYTTEYWLRTRRPKLNAYEFLGRDEWTPGPEV